MEKEKTQQSKGKSFVFYSLKAAQNRLAKLDSEEKLRNPSEIWEAYCDVEQAIEVSKIIFNLHERLGKVRSLTISRKNDPKTIPLDGLIARYKLADSFIASAYEAYSLERGEEGVELARKARDQLKILLLGRRKAERFKLRKR